jgi:hypothetical protein
VENGAVQMNLFMNVQHFLEATTMKIFIIYPIHVYRRYPGSKRKVLVDGIPSGCSFLDGCMYALNELHVGVDCLDCHPLEN